MSIKHMKDIHTKEIDHEPNTNKSDKHTIFDNNALNQTLLGGPSFCGKT